MKAQCDFLRTFLTTFAGLLASRGHPNGRGLQDPGTRALEVGIDLVDMAQFYGTGLSSGLLHEALKS